MNKKTIKLIWDLNELYDILFNYWVTTKKWTLDFEEVSRKLKLLNVLTKNIQEQSRWFLKSKNDYISGWEYFLKNSSQKYEILHNNITKILLWTM